MSEREFGKLAAITFDMERTLVNVSMKDPRLLGNPCLREVLVRPGVIEGFEYLRDNDVNFGIVSNSSADNIRLALDTIGVGADLLPDEDIISGNSTYTVTRPAPNVTPPSRIARLVMPKGIETTPVVKVKKFIANKPSPEGINYLLNKWSVEPEYAFHVGDVFEEDGKAAEAAGVGFIQVKFDDFLNESVLDLVRQAAELVNR